MKTAVCLAALRVSVLLPAAPDLHAAQLNDTGQIACYDEAGTVTGTVSSGSPAPEAPGFEAQDCSLDAAAANAAGAQLKVGTSSVPGRDYTKIANNGIQLPTTAMRGSNPTDWGCTRDNVTGLVWMLSPPGSSP